MDRVEVCPVDCFYEGESMLVIHTDECIDYGVCEPECPVDAIKADTEKWLSLAEQCARPASLHRRRNQLPNPFAANGLPNAVTRNVRLPKGVALMISFSSVRTGIESEIGFRLRFFTCVKLSQPSFKGCHCFTKGKPQGICRGAHIR